MKTALLIGSTGLTGEYLLDLLCNSSQYDKVISFSHRETDQHHVKLTKHIVNFDNPQEYCHLVKGDDFFCTLGTTIKKAGSKQAFKQVDFEYPKQFAQCAMDNNVANFMIISAIGASSNSSNFYSKTKGEIEDFLQQSNFTGISIIRPSLLLGNRGEFRLAERIGGLVMQLFSFAFVGNLAKYKAIQAETVAKAMYKIAQNNCTGFQIYESDELEKIGGN